MMTVKSRNPRISWFWMILGSCLLLALSAVPVLGQSSRSVGNRLEILQQHHAEKQRDLSQSLENLAQSCEEKGLTEAAAQVRKRARPFETQLLRVDSLPETVQPDLPHNLPPEQRFWQAQLRHLQKEYAAELYLLSRRAIQAQHPSYAYDLIREVAFHDPDHPRARRLLGFVRYQDRWITPFTREQLRKRYVWHETFGWLPEAHVERYENGQRFYNGRWIRAAQEAEIRRDFQHAWEVRTDHYLVKTNVSLERGVEVATALEDFYRFFFQTFAGFFQSKAQMQKLFEGAAGSLRHVRVSRPYVVHYYRSKDEYVRRLQRKLPQVSITNGLYLTGDRIAHFFENTDPEVDGEGTLFHEATHQLFYESHPRQRPIAQEKNFWITEGIACYMESFQRENGQFTAGDPSYLRFEAARYRYLVDGYYMPLAEFTTMGMQEFQRRPRPEISRDYSQASGLSHFFMHYENGKYRDALIEHLSQLYSPNRFQRENPDSLAELIGVSFEDLDRQYQKHLEQMPKKIE